MSLINIIAKLVFTWTAAMGWHLWRIATGRPYFRTISDSRDCVVSFMLVFLMTSCARWSLMRDGDWIIWAISNSLHIGLLGTISLKAGRTKALFCVFLGASAVAALTSTVSMLLGLTEISDGTGPQGWVNDGVELVLVLVCYLRFRTLDPSMRQSGFGTNNRPLE